MACVCAQPLARRGRFMRCGACGCTRTRGTCTVCWCNRHSIIVVEYCPAAAACLGRCCDVASSTRHACGVDAMVGSVVVISGRHGRLHAAVVVADAAYGGTNLCQAAAAELSCQLSDSELLVGWPMLHPRCCWLFVLSYLPTNNHRISMNQS